MATQAPTHVGHVVWHELSTSSVDKATSFYSDLLGWGVEVWKPGEMDYPMISVDGTTHGGFQPAEAGRPSFWFGHIAVADTDEAAGKATARGATVLAGPMEVPEIGRFALIRDPQGAVCSLYTPVGEGPAAEGVFAWDELMTEDVEASTAFYTDVAGWTTSEMDMGDMTYTNGCTGVNSIEWFEGVATVGGFPAQQYAPPVLGTQFVDLGSCNRSPTNMARRVGVPHITQYIASVDIP